MHLIIIYFKNILLCLYFLSLTASSMATPPPLLTAAAETKATTGRSWTENIKPSVLIMILILSVTVIVSISICLLLRYLKNRRCFRQLSPSPTSAPAINRVNPEPSPPSTRSNKDSTVSGDCAVCLSKFEPSDKPKLLPLCGHAFHAHCIDTWLASNKTCPLCRSPLFASWSSDLTKGLHGAIGNNGSGSFRLELGSIGGGQQPGSESRERRSNSVGSFDYIVEDESEVTGNPSHRRNVSDKEEIGGAKAPGLSAEVPTGSGRSRVKDYVDGLSFTLSSRAVSFRSSGRFFTGSSRRSDISGGADYDVEANRVGEEISEMFRWFSGV